MDEPRVAMRRRVMMRNCAMGMALLVTGSIGCQTMGPAWSVPRSNAVIPPSIGDEIRYQDETIPELQQPELPDFEEAMRDQSDRPPERVSETVSEVRITGNSSVPTHQILRNIRTRPGRYFDPDLLRQDIDQLWKMKELRRVNGPFLQQTEQGVIVTIDVAERPYVKKIRFVGNRAMTDWQLKRKLQLKEGEPLDLHQIGMARQQLEEYYHEEGFRQTQVSIAEGSESGDQDIVFIVNEDEKERVLWVEFEGNEFATDARLRSFVQAKPTLMNSIKGFAIDRNEIDQDVTRLTAYYRTFGYFNARIGREVIESPDSNWVRVRFVIDEGPRYMVNNVSFIGNQKYSSDQLEQLLKLKPADGANPEFNSGEMKADVGALRDLYGSEGHVFADVQVEPRFLDEPGKIDLVYLIEEGKQYRVGKINIYIDGDPGITKRDVFFNRLTLQPGDVIDVRKIRRSTQLLNASQIVADGSPGSGPAARIEVKPKILQEIDRYVEQESIDR